MTVQKRYHIIIDLTGISSQQASDKESLEKFLEDFPPVIGMHVLHPPVVTSGIPQNPGLSGFVIIDYSHISIHTFTKKNEALVDIFSCKPYNQERAMRAVLNYFQVQKEAALIQQVSWG